jgi:DNA-binding transcriptional ArsR family regulator
MSIAQPLVAGEGHLHLDDCDALSAYQAESVNLPWVIFRAAFRASRTEQLSTRARAVLAALARTVDASKPYAAIYARRELLTGRAMLSMRTLYRSLDDLENAGLIERRPQSRYVEAGLFGRAYLHLTERAAILLGLVDLTMTNRALDDPEAQTHSKPSSGVSVTPPSATVADGAIYKNLYPASIQKRQPGQVPADLQRLRALGFFDFLIFKLMREARERGKRLSDVVEATWDHLKLAKAPINYLRTLLRNPVDFSQLVRRRIDAQASESDRAALREHALQLAREHAGKSFVDADGLRQYCIQPDGKSMTITSAEEGVARQAINWMQPFAVALRSARIRLATTADLEAFGVARRRAITTNAPDSVRVQRPMDCFSVFAQQRPPVTQEVRAHIASLHRLLQTRKKAT